MHFKIQVGAITLNPSPKRWVIFVYKLDADHVYTIFELSDKIIK